MPIRTKQIAASILFQIISTLGIGAVGGYLIVSSGRLQLEKQAASEVEMTKQSYLTKINQMGLGSKGQSDNGAIIAIASTYQAKKPLDPNALKTVRRILLNESKARNIEYATIVGTDLKIIVNASKDTKGKTFNPDNLVGDAIGQDIQVKANSIVSWKDFTTQQKCCLSRTK